ncbi:MAG: substrate-binding domain-containing protein [Vicinamibacteria bacterium]
MAAQDTNPDRRTVLVLLPGDPASDQTDHYQILQAEKAQAEGKKTGVAVEVLFAPGFDHLRTLRKRLGDPKAPRVDAVITEPASLSTMDLILRDLKGKTGLVLLNIWGPSVEEQARTWGSGHPIGTVSTDHGKIGALQGRQIAQFVPDRGRVLCVTGPSRASAAQQRLEGVRSTLRSDIQLLHTEAGDWNEADGIVAFNSWYGIFKARIDVIHVIAAQSDELAMGALRAVRAVANAAHREMLSKARFLGVDACPGFGKKLVDEGTLAGSVMTPANTDIAIRHVVRFWADGTPVPLRSFSEAKTYP